MHSLKFRIAYYHTTYYFCSTQYLYDFLHALNIWVTFAQMCKKDIACAFCNALVTNKPVVIIWDFKR